MVIREKASKRLLKPNPVKKSIQKKGTMHKGIIRI